MNCRRAVLSAVFLSAVMLSLVVTGCGYQIGMMGHPQIHTVAVAPAENETLEYNLASQLRSMLCEGFMQDGTYKLTGVGNADCIIYAKVKKVTYSEISYSEEDSSTRIEDDMYLPDEWRVSVSVEYCAVVPGRAAPLLGPSTVTGTARFDNSADNYTVRNSGNRQALHDAARQIVTQVSEGW